MRRSRRSGHGSPEFGGSGEDSFVAVVVTKLTGALLFILLLTMVIMALLPKAVDLPSDHAAAEKADAVPLEVTMPDKLPEAIAGHPYALALAARGGSGPHRWNVDGALPDGLSFDPSSAQIRGTPKKGTPLPVSLVLRVSDGDTRAARTAELLVYESDTPLATPSRWAPKLPPIPWHAWLEQGVGFLILGLVHMVGMNTLANLQRRSFSNLDSDSGAELERSGVSRRFLIYRWMVRGASVASIAALACWLVQQRA